MQEEKRRMLAEQLEELIADNVELCAENAKLKEELRSSDGTLMDPAKQNVEWGSDEHLRGLTVDVLFAEVRYWHKLSVDEMDKCYALFFDACDLLDEIVEFMNMRHDCTRCPFCDECNRTGSAMQACTGRDIVAKRVMMFKEKSRP